MKKPKASKTSKAPKTAAVSTDADGTRDAKGRFGPGNKAATGNKYAKRVHELRQGFLDTVTAQDVVEVTLTLVRLAKAGDMAAIKELFDRGLGKFVDQAEGDEVAGKSVTIDISPELLAELREPLSPAKPGQESRN